MANFYLNLLKKIYVILKVFIALNTGRLLTKDEKLSNEIIKKILHV